MEFVMGALVFGFSILGVQLARQYLKGWLDDTYATREFAWNLDAEAKRWRDSFVDWTDIYSRRLSETEKAQSLLIDDLNVRLTTLEKFVYGSPIADRPTTDA